MFTLLLRNSVWRAWQADRAFRQAAIADCANGIVAMEGRIAVRNSAAPAMLPTVLIRDEERHLHSIPHCPDPPSVTGVPIVRWANLYETDTRMLPLHCSPDGAELQVCYGSAPRGGFRIGIDLGGTRIEGVVLGPAGAALMQERIPTPRGDYRPSPRSGSAFPVPQP